MSILTYIEYPLHVDEGVAVVYALETLKTTF